MIDAVNEVTPRKKRSKAERRHADIPSDDPRMPMCFEARMVRVMTLAG